MHIDAAAQKPGIDHVSVHCLDHKENNNCDQEPAEITGHKADKNCRTIGDNGADIGDQIADSAQDTDNHGILDADQRKRGADQHCHEKGIDQLTTDVTRKDRIRIFCQNMELSAGLSAADCQQHPVPVPHQTFSVQKEIDREDHSK